MPRLTPILLFVALAAICCTAKGQEVEFDLRRDQPQPARTDLSSGAPSMTPEMWFYEQERSRYDDPQMAIRRRAEQRAAERRERLASQEWYGISNSRPMVSSTPVFGSYSAFWGSNTMDPFRWRPVAPPVFVLRPVGPLY